ncbi:Hint domain-containing protein [Paracoccus sp. (in: a-proteobacteria)]|uniref:Hint domain-containing protein n=1 Tax=Paracoccus sp. TaxID=267 RepID=UPI00272AA1C2|nr:Hint domain-containing protein [Paracoccus sp. (in: a-proteobacteria)]
MEREITVLTVSQPINVGSGSPQMYAPFFGRTTPFTLDGPVISTIHLLDDDDRFHNSIYTPDETGQSLTRPATIGFGDTAVTLPAGTRLNNFIGSIMVDSEGNRFAMILPRRFVPDDLGEELGDRHSVLVFPLPVTGSDGATTFPRFDPTLPLRYAEVYQIGGTENSLAYAPPAEPALPDDPPPCLAEGTLVQTSTGPVPVERVRPGARLMTLDHGWQRLLWSGSRHLDRRALDLRPQDRPIRIEPGALGPGQPSRTLFVSPQHRVLLRSRIARRMFGHDEIMVPARHLLGLPGISVDHGALAVTYWHLLTENHQILLTEGAWTESLLPGPQALRAFGPALAAAIRDIAPALAADPVPARPVPPGHATRRLLRRHIANPARALVEAAPESVT